VVLESLNWEQQSARVCKKGQRSRIFRSNSAGGDQEREFDPRLSNRAGQLRFSGNGALIRLHGLSDIIQ
jgi:hypothetical protein